MLFGPAKDLKPATCYLLSFDCAQDQIEHLRQSRSVSLTYYQMKNEGLPKGENDDSENAKDTGAPTANASPNYMPILNRLLNDL